VGCQSGHPTQTYATYNAVDAHDRSKIQTIITTRKLYSYTYMWEEWGLEWMCSSINLLFFIRVIWQTTAYCHRKEVLMIMQMIAK